MKNKLALIIFAVAMIGTAYIKFKSLDGIEDVFAVSFDEDQDADF